MFKFVGVMIFEFAEILHRGGSGVDIWDDEHEYIIYFLET